MIESGTGDWMQTFSSGKFFPLDPRPEDVRIVDIAQSLSQQCRYNGHTRRFYSVAEHSVLVSRAVPPQHALWGLMHDAPETYLFDMIRPLKRLPMAFEFRQVEARIMRAICQKYGMPEIEPPEVKDIDNRICLTEGAVLMPNPPEPWNIEGPPVDVEIECWSCEEARDMFLERFFELRTED